MAERAVPQGMHYRPRQGASLHLLTAAEHAAEAQAARDERAARQRATDAAYRAALGVPGGPIPKQLGSCSGHGSTRRLAAVPRVEAVLRVIR